jgi:hypothetical protein
MRHCAALPSQGNTGLDRGGFDVRYRDDHFHRIPVTVEGGCMMTAYEWLQDALGRYQVTHIHSSIRNALKVMDLTEVDQAGDASLEPASLEVPSANFSDGQGIVPSAPVRDQGTESLEVASAHDEPVQGDAPSYLIEGMSREKLVALCKRWEKAHCEAGLIGSEYYADPERVFQRVRDQRDSLHRGLMRAIQREKAAGCLARGTARCNRA